MGSSSTNKKLNHKNNNHKDKEKRKTEDRETNKDLSANVDESFKCLTSNPPELELSRDLNSSPTRPATSSSQRRRQLQFQRQKETNLYNPHSSEKQTSPNLMGGGELVNCIAYDDNSLVIERKPSPTSPASSRRYLKAETPTHGSRKYRKAIKSDLEVVIVKPEHHHQHRAPTITLPVPATVVGHLPISSGSSSNPTVLQQRYIQLQHEHEKKFICNAMKKFNNVENSNTRNSRA